MGTHFIHSTKSPHSPLGGKIGPLRNSKRVLCWSIYIIILRCTTVHTAFIVAVAELGVATIFCDNAIKTLGVQLGRLPERRAHMVYFLLFSPTFFGPEA